MPEFWSIPDRDDRKPRRRLLAEHSMTGHEYPQPHIVSSPPGTQAPAHLINYTPDTNEVHGPGSMAPLDRLNYSLMPHDGLRNGVGAGADYTGALSPGAPPGPGTQPGMDQITGRYGQQAAMRSNAFSPGQPPLSPTPYGVGPGPRIQASGPSVRDFGTRGSMQGNASDFGRGFEGVGAGQEGRQTQDKAAPGAFQGTSDGAASSSGDNPRSDVRPGESPGRAGGAAARAAAGGSDDAVGRRATGMPAGAGYRYKIEYGPADREFPNGRPNILWLVPDDPSKPSIPMGGFAPTGDPVPTEGTPKYMGAFDQDTRKIIMDRAAGSGKTSSDFIVEEVWNAETKATEKRIFDKTDRTDLGRVIGRTAPTEPGKGTAGDTKEIGKGRSVIVQRVNPDTGVWEIDQDLTREARQANIDAEDLEREDKAAQQEAEILKAELDYDAAMGTATIFQTIEDADGQVYLLNGNTGSTMRLGPKDMAKHRVQLGNTLVFLDEKTGQVKDTYTAPKDMTVADYNGVTYQYDPRNPSGTMKELFRDPFWQPTEETKLAKSKADLAATLQSLDKGEIDEMEARMRIEKDLFDLENIKPEMMGGGSFYLAPGAKMRIDYNENYGRGEKLVDTGPMDPRRKAAIDTMRGQLEKMGAQPRKGAADYLAMTEGLGKVDTSKSGPTTSGAADAAAKSTGGEKPAVSAADWVRADQEGGRTPPGNELASEPGKTGTVSPDDPRYLGSKATPEQIEAARAEWEAQQAGESVGEELTAEPEPEPEPPAPETATSRTGWKPKPRAAAKPAPTIVDYETPWHQQAYEAGIGGWKRANEEPDRTTPWYEQALRASIGGWGAGQDVNDEDEPEVEWMNPGGWDPIKRAFAEIYQAEQDKLNTRFDPNQERPWVDLSRGNLELDPEAREAMERGEKYPSIPWILPERGHGRTGGIATPESERPPWSGKAPPGGSGNWDVKRPTRNRPPSALEGINRRALGDPDLREFGTEEDAIRLGREQSPNAEDVLWELTEHKEGPQILDIGKGHTPGPGLKLGPNVFTPPVQLPGGHKPGQKVELPEWLSSLSEEVRNKVLSGMGAGQGPGMLPPAPGGGTGVPPSAGQAPGAGPPGAPPMPPLPPQDVAGIGHRFGQPMNEGEPFHSGVDLQAQEGTPTVSPEDGIIEEVRDDPSGLGLTVIVRDKNGMQHKLGHLSSTDAYRGMVVAKGQNLARVGSSGNTTGSHLHWAVRDQAGQPTDPTPALGAMGGLPPVPGTEMMGPPGGSGSPPGMAGPPTGAPPGAPPPGAAGMPPEGPPPGEIAKSLGMGQDNWWEPLLGGAGHADMGAGAEGGMGAGEEPGYMGITPDQQAGIDAENKRIDMEAENNRRDNETRRYIADKEHEARMKEIDQNWLIHQDDDKRQQEINAENTRHNQAQEQIERDRIQADITIQQMRDANAIKLQQMEQGNAIYMQQGEQAFQDWQNQQKYRMDILGSALKNPWLQKLSGMTPGPGYQGQEIGGQNISNLVNQVLQPYDPRAWGAQNAPSVAGLGGTTAGGPEGELQTPGGGMFQQAGTPGAEGGGAPQGGAQPGAQAAGAQPTAYMQGGQVYQGQVPQGYNYQTGTGTPDYMQWRGWDPFQKAAYRTNIEALGPGAWEAEQSRIGDQFAQAGGTPEVTRMQAAASDAAGRAGMEMTGEMFGQTGEQFWQDQSKQWGQAKAPTVRQNLQGATGVR